MNKTKWSLNLGKIFGINVLVHFTFVLIFVYMGYYGWENYHSVSMVLYLFLIVIISFICVLMHEFGHVLAARRVGIGTRQILILPIGGMAQIESMPENPKEELFVTICGPLVNLGIVLFLLPFAFFSHSIQQIILLINQGASSDIVSSAIFNNLLLLVILLNIGLFIFNLIPAYPMDGGRIFRAFLAYRFKYVNATLIAVRTGQMIALFYFLFTVINFVIYQPTNQLSSKNEKGLSIPYQDANNAEKEDRPGYFEIIRLFVLCGFIGSIGEMEYRMVKRKHHMGGYGISGSTNNSKMASITVSNSIGEAVWELTTNRCLNLPIMFLDQVAGRLSWQLPDSLMAENNFASHTYKPYPDDSLGHVIKMMKILKINALPVFETNHASGPTHKLYLMAE